MAVINLSTADRVRRVIGEALGVEPEQTRDEAKLVDDLGADSMDLAEISILLDGEFDLETDVDALDEASTVRDVVALVEGQLGAPA